MSKTLDQLLKTLIRGAKKRSPTQRAKRVKKLLACINALDVRIAKSRGK